MKAEEVAEICKELQELLRFAWDGLYIEQKVGETQQQQGERSAYNHGVFKTLEHVRAALIVNIERGKRDR